MTTESIIKRIEVIRQGSKNSSKIRDLINFVQVKIQEIKDWNLRDSLEEKLTNACKQ